MQKSTLFLVIVALAISAVDVTAEVPQMINYQGRLTDPEGVSVEDGPYLIKFKIYGSESGDDSLWSSGYQPVQVVNGLLTYQLGQGNPLPYGLFSTIASLWLGITVGADEEINPRTKLTSVSYAYHSLRSDTTEFAKNAIPSGVIVMWSGLVGNIPEG